ncbi:MAG: hypothetical protein ABJG41_01675 [Cyclobacteriaceae bacterium]
MKNSPLLIILCIWIASSNSSAQHHADYERSRWLAAASNFEPQLFTQVKRPVRVVSTTEDESAFQGIGVVFKENTDLFFNTSAKENSGKILDFGEHLTGHVTFSVEQIGLIFDGAIRLKFTFGETPSEVATSFDSYNGTLSRAWLQDETITITEMPSSVTFSRRLAFRYVKMEVVGCSDFADFKVSGLYVSASTSAKARVDSLPASTSKLIKKIDQVALHTLSECMQTVFEDGPKRDRRLWIGDLYLQMLANHHSFKNDSLVKHCLYLIAGLSYDNGTVPPTLYERPVPNAPDSPLLDYALIYNVILREYLLQTGDTRTIEDLWPVAKKQVENTMSYINNDGLVDYERTDKDWWIFFDWHEKLDKQTSLQGCMIWAYQQTYDLAKILGKEGEVEYLPELTQRMSKAALDSLYDNKMGVFFSGADKQVSYASQAWMILSGVASKVIGSNALQNLNQLEGVTKPGSPYLYHFVIEAMIKVGLEEDARKRLENYWGGMINKGADTFWEVYRPEDDFASPYNAHLVNSYCHAWSCTPVYFIRKYPHIFK